MDWKSLKNKVSGLFGASSGSGGFQVDDVAQNGLARHGSPLLLVVDVKTPENPDFFPSYKGRVPLYMTCVQGVEGKDGSVTSDMYTVELHVDRGNSSVLEQARAIKPGEWIQAQGEWGGQFGDDQFRARSIERRSDLGLVGNLPKPEDLGGVLDDPQARVFERHL